MKPKTNLLAKGARRWSLNMELLDHLDINANELTLINALALRCDYSDPGQAFACGKTELMRAAKIGCPKTFGRVRTKLVERGYALTIPADLPGGKTLYCLQWYKLFDDAENARQAWFDSMRDEKRLIELAVRQYTAQADPVLASVESTVTCTEPPTDTSTEVAYLLKQATALTAQYAEGTPRSCRGRNYDE